MTIDEKIQALSELESEYGHKTLSNELSALKTIRDYHNKKQK